VRADVEAVERVDREVGQELAVVGKVTAYLEGRLKLDREEFFVGGFSMGGWRASSMGEGSPSTWAGMAILGAGREVQDRPLRKPASFRNKPIYVGAGTQDANFPHARKAASVYEAAGAKVTFEEYPGLGHTMKMDSAILRDWLWTNGPVRLAKSRLAAARSAETLGRLGKAYALYRELALISDKDEPCVAAAAAAKAIGEQAEKKLAEGVKAMAEKRYGEAARALALLATRYEGSAFGERADRLIKNLQSDPAARAAIEQSKLEPAKTQPPDLPAPEAARECLAWLRMADNYLAAGKPDRAREYLQKILDKHAGTDWAAQARERLAKIQGAGE
jgi:dienelactone hydrolase